jgi:hypothetical protein
MWRVYRLLLYLANGLLILHQKEVKSPTEGIRLIYNIRTVRKMNLILRSIERRPQMQFSMGRKFKLWQ